MNILYYLGGIIANAGLAMLAISLVFIRTKIPEVVKRSDLENVSALIAILFLTAGVTLQIIGLFEIIKV